MYQDSYITQLSGKFSNNDNGIFRLKNKLSQIGIEVRYPRGQSIVAVKNEIALSFIPTNDHSLFDEEVMFIQSIKSSDFHLVHNVFGEIQGYIGQSTSLEVCFAMLIHKPVLFLHSFVFGHKINHDVMQILKKNSPQFYFARIDQFPPSQVKKTLRVLKDNYYIQYQINDSEISLIKQNFISLFKEYAQISGYGVSSDIEGEKHRAIVDNILRDL